MTRTLLRISIFAVAVGFPLDVAAVHGQRAPGWIGIGFEVWSGDATLDQRTARVNGIVTEVREGSPAANAGIEVGDRLLTINDASTADEFANLAERLALRVGDRVDIALMREGRRMDVSLRAGARPADFATWPAKPAAPADAMVETMFRAMDSLRVQILASSGAQPVAAPRRAATVAVVPEVPATPHLVSAPFEFFVFRSELHDSLELEMEALNRRLRSLRDQERHIADLRRARGTSRAEARALDAQLADVQAAVESVTLQSSELRAAMAEAARVSAGIQYEPGWPVDVSTPPATVEPEPFRPLTPYLLGSNRVAGAEVIDLRPGLAEYFRVDGGVLVIDVAPGTPAATVGMQAGDVIVKLDRVQVRSVDALRLGISRAGDTLPVTLIRRGSSLEVLLRRR
jgi:membrane-associated protease RseP (regulator of RpoE activity)